MNQPRSPYRPFLPRASKLQPGPVNRSVKKEEKLKRQKSWLDGVKRAKRTSQTSRRWSQYMKKGVEKGEGRAGTQGEKGAGWGGRIGENGEWGEGEWKGKEFQNHFCRESSWERLSCFLLPRPCLSVSQCWSPIGLARTQGCANCLCSAALLPPCHQMHMWLVLSISFICKPNFSLFIMLLI